MPKLSVLSPRRRSVQAGLLAAAALPAAALTLAAPAQAATYTASACSYASNTQCIATGRSLAGYHANDVYPKNNNTLNEWRFNGSSIQISTHIGSVAVFIRKKVSYCYGSYGNDTCVTIQPHDPRIDAAGMYNSAGRTFLSFKWNA